MSQFNQQEFIRQLPILAHSESAQSCWTALADAVGAHAEQTLTATDTGLDPLSGWWQSCFELLSASQIQIKHLNFQASDLGEDEFIELVNKGPAILDISGWRINAGDEGQDMTFPTGTQLQPQQSIKVYTENKGDYHFNSPNPIWNNKGDSALIYNADGILVYSWAYGSDAHKAVKLSHIHYDGQEYRTEGDEYAEISNDSEHWVDLSQWQLSAGLKQVFTFPGHARIAPKSSVRVYTNRDNPGTGGFSFNSPTAVWNNLGDVGKLLDHKGQLVSEYRY